ncbi:MAG: hypothetical protein AB2A00_13020 [Myxococcota bacterium]
MSSLSLGCANNGGFGEDAGPGSSSGGNNSCPDSDPDCTPMNVVCAGQTCQTGDVCDDGQCAEGCEAGKIACRGLCVDPESDPSYCGAQDDCRGDNRGDACGAGYVCNAGECRLNCAQGQVACNGRCVDPFTDENFCGATGDCQGANAGDQCAAGEVCNGAGQCTVNCAAGYINCGGRCVNPVDDRVYCGASGDCQGPNDGTTCGPGQVCENSTCTVVCPTGYINCSGSCVDPQSDEAHCGASGDCTGGNVGQDCADGQICVNGACSNNGCPGGQVMCGGRCVSPESDEDYCGAQGDCQGANAGRSCADGYSCEGGQCVISCPTGQIACGGTCVDPRTDNNYCGAQADCQGANAGAQCNAGYVCNGSGECALSCQQGFIVCDGQCINPRTDPLYCGAAGSCTGPAAGTACLPGQVCNGSGQCATSCAPGLIACDGSCIDPTSDNRYCGASGTCTGTEAGQTCDNGFVCNGSGVCELSCQDGLVACNGICVNPSINRNYCGATGTCTGVESGEQCTDGEVCYNGSCVVNCPADQIACDGRCVSPLSDVNYCGASGSCTGASAGQQCPVGFTCNNGDCQQVITVTCPPGQVACNGACVDPSTNPLYCGAYGDCFGGTEEGQQCGPGQVCNGAGECAATCAQGYVSCNGRCVDPLTDAGYCGAYGTCTGGGAGQACAQGDVCNGLGECTANCAPGFAECNGRCVDPDTDNSYCGASPDCSNDGYVCAGGQVCNGAGTCANNCIPGYVNCDGRCVDPDSDPAHCGAYGACTGGGVGQACAANQVCNGGGQCAADCLPGFINCYGRCINPDTDGEYCGAYGACIGGQVGQQCAAGQVCNGGGTCDTECLPGLVNCYGTCINPATDGEFCGAYGACTGNQVGQQCATGQVCDGTGVCAPVCADGYVNCGGVCINPDTDAYHCGATADCSGANAGAACPSGQYCDGTGQCGNTCAGGYVLCDGTCVNPQNNALYCGASGACTATEAGQECGVGSYCDNGACVVPCPAGLVSCGGQCVDPLSDPDYCGASRNCAGPYVGQDCVAGQVCNGNGACATECAAGYVNCGGICVNPLTDAQYCGAYGDCTGNADGTACPTGQVCNGGGQCADACLPGWVSCGGVCINPDSDARFCAAYGDCTGNGAGEACPNGYLCDGTGECAVECAAGYVNCNGICVDPNNDPLRCGAYGACTGAGAGAVCPNGYVCDGTGTCAVSCANGYVNCNGSCIDPDVDNTYCGASGACDANTNGDTCATGQYCNGAGTCADTCVNGYIACDGTCVNPLNDERYCGAAADCTGGNAGDLCADTQFCYNGYCRLVCPDGQIDCNGTCIDPNSNNTYCGASGECVADPGVTCPNGYVCDGTGQCSLNCLGGTVNCGGTCVDPQTDENYCGAQTDCTGANAGEICDATYECRTGACQCPVNQVACNGRCIDPLNDETYCGAQTDCAGGNAGEVCVSTQQCVTGDCQCPNNQVLCGGNCINPTNTDTYCGATGDCQAANAGQNCDATARDCVNSQCVCPNNGVFCNGACIDPLNNNTYCGAFGACDANSDGQTCAGGTFCQNGQCVCPTGQVFCGGQCIDPTNTDAYCGASNDCQAANAGVDCNATGRDCVNSQCQCPNNGVFCNGACIDPLNNNTYCGAFGACDANSDGQTCAGGTFCQNGQCVCPTNQVFCGGNCIDPTNTDAYCGASNDCQAANAGVDCNATGRDCVNSQCQCPNNGVFCNNTCIDPLNDEQYCGATNTNACTTFDTCVNGEVCTNGTCQCPTGQVLCNGTCIDPNNNNTYCGAFGACDANSDGEQCFDGSSCSGGHCLCNGGEVYCGGNCINPNTDPIYCGASGFCDNATTDGNTCNADQFCNNGTCQALPEFLGIIITTDGGGNQVTTYSSPWPFAGHQGASAQCASQYGVGTAHVCTYAELQQAQGQADFGANNYNFWTHVDGNTGGCGFDNCNCVNWSYTTGHISAGWRAAVNAGSLQAAQTSGCPGNFRQIPCCR